MLSIINNLLRGLKHDWGILTLFIIFLIANGAYLRNFPGLVGDEGYEGLSVVEHIEKTRSPALGRESYVSVWVDYARAPFILLMGPTALALRIPFYFASIVIFWLAWKTYRLYFGNYPAYFAMVFSLLSPAFLLYQRISWPINLLPIFALAILISVKSKKNYAIPLAGFFAGLGASTHFIFLGLAVAILSSSLFFNVKKANRIKYISRSVVGFIAGFGFQLAVLLTFTVENSRAGGLADFEKRLMDLPFSLAQYASASTYFSEYTGNSLPNYAIFLIMALLLFGAGLSLFIKPRKIAVSWIAGLVIASVVTAFIVNYFRVRYFHTITIGFWALSGVGIGKLIVYLKYKDKYKIFPLSFAMIFLLWTTKFALLPYLVSGGSTKIYNDSSVSLDTAGHFSEISPLIACVNNMDMVYAREPKISNRLKFIAKQNVNLKISDNAKAALWFIDYRGSESTERNPKEQCPGLINYIVIPNEKFQR